MGTRIRGFLGDVRLTFLGGPECWHINLNTGRCVYMGDVSISLAWRQRDPPVLTCHVSLHLEFYLPIREMWGDRYYTPWEDSFDSTARAPTRASVVPMEVSSDEEDPDEGPPEDPESVPFYLRGR